MGDHVKRIKTELELVHPYTFHGADHCLRQWGSVTVFVCPRCSKPSSLPHKLVWNKANTFSAIDPDGGPGTIVCGNNCGFHGLLADGIMTQLGDLRAKDCPPFIEPPSEHFGHCCPACRTTLRWDELRGWYFCSRCSHALSFRDVEMFVGNQLNKDGQC